MAEQNSGSCPPARRLTNKARRRAAILQATRELFVLHGAHATKMDDIAERADISRATLFNYFPTRADIIRALVDEFDDNFHVRLKEWREKPIPPAERMMGVFLETAAELEQLPHAKTIIGFSEMGWIEAEGSVRMQRLSTAFAHILGYDDSQRSEWDDSVAEAAVSIYVGIIHNWRLRDDYELRRHLVNGAQLIMALANLPRH